MSEPYAGMRLGRWLILEPERRLPMTEAQVRHGHTTGKKAALCRCECGTEKLVSLAALRQRTSTSCGCWRRENSTAMAKNITSAEHSRRRRTHGLSGNPVYHACHNAISRCHNPNNRGYRNYGAQGIQVAPQWRDVVEFTLGVLTEIGERPNGMTLDRIDNSRGYEPGNIRWLSMAEQLRNRRLFTKWTSPTATETRKAALGVAA